MTEEQIMQVQQMQLDQIGTGMGMGMIIFMVVAYVFWTYSLATLASKMGMSFGKAFIWALIPIANLFLVLKLASKPMWWFILYLIPIVNIIINVLVWISISEGRGKPGWWGMLISLVPIANIIFYLMLCFGAAGGRIEAEQA
jgi:Family of unknown function (DUF5684)